MTKEKIFNQLSFVESDSLSSRRLNKFSFKKSIVGNFIFVFARETPKLPNSTIQFYFSPVLWISVVITIFILKKGFMTTEL